MPKITLDNLRSLGDVNQTFRWNFVLISAPSGVPGFPSSSSIDLRCETAELPKKSGSSVEVTLRGHSVKYPGIYKPTGTMTLTFVETVDNFMANWLRSWQVACWPNNTGARLPKSQLEAVIQLQLLRNDDTARYQYTIKGCFLEDATIGSLDSSSADPFKPQLVLSYDDFTQGPL